MEGFQGPPPSPQGRGVAALCIGAGHPLGSCAEGQQPPQSSFCGDLLPPSPFESGTQPSPTSHSLGQAQSLGPRREVQCV